MGTQQRFTFNAVASLYDACRPGYPAALFDALFTRARCSRGARALEIGCGTGQATRVLADRGLCVLALEPGEQLAALAQQNLSAFPDVEVQSETFEQASLDTASFDLVIAAQSFHWIAPEVSFSKSWRVLRPGGALAIIGNAVSLNRPPAFRDIDTAYATHAPTIVGPPVTRWYAADGPLEGLMREAEGFRPPQVERFPWTERYSAHRYCDLLRTHSDHQLLKAEQREGLLAAVSEIIESQGGGIEIEYEANLYLAERDT
jgi:SAM-dependent methyltransferase